MTRVQQKDNLTVREREEEKEEDKLWTISRRLGTSEEIGGERHRLKKKAISAILESHEGQLLLRCRRRIWLHKGSQRRRPIRVALHRAAHE